MNKTTRTQTKKHSKEMVSESELLKKIKQKADEIKQQLLEDYKNMQNNNFGLFLSIGNFSNEVINLINNVPFFNKVQFQENTIEEEIKKYKYIVIIFSIYEKEEREKSILVADLCKKNNIKFILCASEFNFRRCLNLPVKKEIEELENKEINDYLTLLNNQKYAINTIHSSKPFFIDTTEQDIDGLKYCAYITSLKNNSHIQTLNATIVANTIAMNVNYMINGNLNY